MRVEARSAGKSYASSQKRKHIGLRSEVLRTLVLLDAGDAEVESLREAVSGTGYAVARVIEVAQAARASAAVQAAGASGSLDTYKELDIGKATEAHAKALHAYDVARQADKHAARRRDRGAYNFVSITLPAEARDHRRRRVVANVYRAPPWDVS